MGFTYCLSVCGDFEASGGTSEINRAGLHDVVGGAETVLGHWNCVGWG